MCEFKAYLDGKLVFEEVHRARTKGKGVILIDVLGRSKELEDCRIVEVDVPDETLRLSSG